MKARREQHDTLPHSAQYFLGGQSELLSLYERGLIRGMPVKTPGLIAGAHTMQSCKSIIAEITTLVLSTDSDLFKYLKRMSPYAGADPAQIAAENR